MVVDPAQDRLIDQMVTARLVTSDADAIELAHEAVVRAWPRLRGWLEDDLRGPADPPPPDPGRGGLGRLRSSRRATSTAAPASPRRASGSPLPTRASPTSSAASWPRARSRPRPRRRRRSSSRAPVDGMVRRLRYALAGAAVLLVLALITGFVAVGQTGRAHDEADAARARQLGAQALGDADTPLSSLLAVAAVRLDDTPETRATLSRVLARHSSLVATSAPVGDGPVAPASSGARTAPRLATDEPTTSSPSSTSPPAASPRGTTPTGRDPRTNSSSDPALSRSAPTAGPSRSAPRPTRRRRWCSSTVGRSRAYPPSRPIFRECASTTGTSRSPPTDASSPRRSCCSHRARTRTATTPSSAPRRGSGTSST